MLMLQCRFRNGFRCLFASGEVLKQQQTIQYFGGYLMKGIDLDRHSYFKAVGIVKDFKYDGDLKLW